MLKPSNDCLDLIKEFEGYHTKQADGSCKAYRDPGSIDGKPYTIGWGTTRYRTAGLAKYGRTVQRWEEVRTVKPKILFFVHLALSPNSFLT